MQRQEQPIEQPESAGASAADSSSAPRTRRWGLPTRSRATGTEGARSRRIWLGGGAAKGDPESQDARGAWVDSADMAG